MSDDFQDLYENAPCGYFTAGADRRIRSVNGVLSRWLGYPADDLIGEPFTQLFSAGTRIHYETHFAPMLRATGELSGIEVELLTADRGRLPVFLTANLKVGSDGRPDLVRVVLHPAGDRHSYETELLSARQRAEQERAQVEVLVATLRHSLLPPMLSPPAGVEVAAYYHPASVHEVGGDFYDLFPLSERRWGFFLGDVCGKGPSAAVITSLTRYTLRAAAVYNEDPVAVLHNLDTVLRQRHATSDISFCTVIFGLLTPSDTGVDIDLASGGHPPALLLSADGAARYVQTPGGQALGISPQPTFVASSVHMAAGDTLVLYTDGLTEARTGVDNARFDDAGALLRFAELHGPTTAHQIVADIEGVLAQLADGVQDDAAILAIGMPADGAGGG
jgi:phosphoserine phosphatase RsbU/P